ncbi:glycoside hydrolase family 3 N-terminal domain-containing protein [Streptomyces umbrinus]|uniref:glycoside hydrolase family 3 N-terminal domain-containing protein n=1 Tax=Streptomyces umbrinus TaxID=67370 RepID=UPI003C2FE2DF
MNHPLPTGTHRDARLPAGERAALLLREMTLEEKCHQLVSVMPWTLVRPDGSDSDEAEGWLAHPPGHVAGLIVDTPAELAHLVGSIQRQAVERTRLSIPVLFHQEAISGFLAGGHMAFPTGTGLAAAFSPELVQEMTDLIRRQMVRTGVRHALSPVMDVALDPRWGRVHETYGEDPYLCAALGVAFTRGLQGDDLSRGVLATGKHFLGYALPLGGVNTSSFEGGARWTRDVFAYPFEAAIQLAGLRSVMNSYADVDGIPVGVSREVLTGLLREVLGFDGFVSSDYTTLEQIVDRQRVADDAGEAACLAIRAGLDVEMPTPFAYGQVLAAEVAAGRADVRDVDRSVLRVLRAKFELGLFENPYPAERIDVTAVAAEGAELSRELARRSVVLAKNAGILPLAPRALDLAVIGPHADAAKLQFPAYSYASWREAADAVTSGELGNMLGAEDVTASWYKAMFEPVDPEAFVHERFGANSLAEEIARRARRTRTEQGSTLTRLLDEEAVDRAVRIAQEADVVVLALGGGSLWFTGERTEGECSDTADIALPAAQARLADAVAATGKPLIVVLVQGRAYALPESVRDAAAIVVAPYGGPFGPQAVAEVLFGVTNPSGRLPYSIPRHSGQVPVYHHQKAGSGYRGPLPPNVGRHYLDLEATPLYPFAHGLTYTEFTLADVSSDRTTTTAGAVRIGATVTNTGPVAGATVVQLYVRVNTKGVTRPAQQLAGFTRVDLAPGESRRVTFRLAVAQLGCTNAARDFAVEPARVDFFLGFDSDDRRAEGTFEITGEPRILAAADRAFLSHVEIEHV